jgi:hypothetical protein
MRDLLSAGKKDSEANISRSELTGMGKNGVVAEQ